METPVGIIIHILTYVNNWPWTTTCTICARAIDHTSLHMIADLLGRVSRLLISDVHLNSDSWFTWTLLMLVWKTRRPMFPPCQPQTSGQVCNGSPEAVTSTNQSQHMKLLEADFSQTQSMFASVFSIISNLLIPMGAGYPTPALVHACVGTKSES